MSDGMTHLEHKINQFQNLLEEMKEETREAHSTLRMIRRERKEIDRMFKGDVKVLINKRVDETVRTELDKISPQIRAQTNLIYDKVGNQIDKLIRLCLGTELSSAPGHEDIRPELAAKLREWIDEILEEKNGV